MKNIYLIERNIHNAIIIYGRIGKKVYYYYNKKQAIKNYNNLCNKELCVWETQKK